MRRWPVLRGRRWPDDADGGEIRRIAIFVTVSLAVLIVAIDATIVATALHTLERSLHTSISWAGWTITAYTLSFVLMPPLSDKLSSRFGRRRVFAWSVAVFTAASLCCGLVNNVFPLIALRVLQAAGGAGLLPTTMGLVVDHFGDERDRAASLLGSMFPLGGMIGPIFGGLLVNYWSWRGVFFVNVPIGVVLLVMCFVYIPRDRAHVTRAHEPMDVGGMALLGVGLLGGMLGLTYVGEHGAALGSPWFVVPIIAGAAAIVWFTLHVNRVATPFIVPRLIYGRGFAVVNLVNAVVGGIELGVVALVPLYASNRYGIDALGSGMLLVAEGVAAVVLSVAGTVALRRTGYRLPLYGGCGVIALGLVLLALRPLVVSAYVWLVIGTFVFGVGAGAIGPASRNAGLQLAPGEASMISALRSMCLDVGTIAAVAVATTAIAQSRTPGGAEAWVFVAFAAVIVLSLPLIARVPEHRGAW